ncbi:uncharacterized protein A4U43_C04F33940 [Asparagus officinalis]|uniref:DNA excision repair protein ERCC-1 n=1 Tax=Asparagus officinalis TaxID=4686 RepID=A0A5P1FAW1_ASPOF|nr:DNA excision repair protein ERCC-1 [Asparagus officinalis]ONK73660.1 uncharacterized protein A4U43_C04F33940 [Asparagus officinalis]
MEKVDGGEQERKEKRRKAVIQIPSYDEVFSSAASVSSSSAADGCADPRPHNPPRPPPPPPPPNSFSEAFSFVKSSEFYAPPPRPVAESQASTSGSNSSNAPVHSRNAILVSHRQKGNPLLKHIRNVRWTFADIVCDYLLGQSSCALYLSLRYHLLHPDYLYFRIRELQKNFKLRVVLCHVDVEDVIKPLLEVTKTAMLHDCTLLCGWSLEECGRYLETIKVYENKPSDLIREQTDTDYLSRLTHALTTVRRVNKTDVVTLGSTFGSLSGIMDASMDELARCPGIGERKVKRLYDTFHEPFRRVSSRPAVVASETPTKEDNKDKNVEPPSDESEVRKEHTLNVKSALSAAFAKYAERVRKPDEKSSSPEKVEGSSSVTAAPK